ncbi:hypothetical protein [Salinisphaera orenii]|uniref:hypothetical protein n=1 Tax=Salinisphaera orenii TaxID=856731 RepID=UPI000DBE472D
MNWRRLVFAWLLRIALVGIALAAVGFCVWQFALTYYGRGWGHEPASAPWVLGHRARELLTNATSTGKQKTLVDGAVHVRTHGQLSGPDFVNRSHTAPSGSIVGQPWAWWRNRVTASAAGAARGPSFDGEYVSRLLRQIRALPGDYRAYILARSRPQGGAENASAPVVTNRYVAWLAERAPQQLMPVASILPGRANAGQNLAHWVEKGVQRVRWLPVRQHIDLTSAAARTFYKKLAQAKVTLNLPVGAVRDRHGTYRWISPAAIKPMLAAGVDVELTLADARGPKGQELMPALFHLLATSDHAKQITISLANVLAGKRPQQVLKPLLAHPQYYRHLRYASGYPQPALAGRIDVEALADDGFIDRSLVPPLKAIYDVNPLAFALVVMRRVHLPHTRLGFPESVFVRKKS